MSSIATSTSSPAPQSSSAPPTSSSPTSQPSAGAKIPNSKAGKNSKMYNLNVNVNVNLNVSAANTAVTNLLAVESANNTPRTPEILNSLIAMTNPLDDYNYNNDSDKSLSAAQKAGSGNDTASNSSGSPLGSPANSTTPSIQKTCSQLIKAGLKLSIESKRKMSGSDSLDGMPLSKKLKREEQSDEDCEDSSHSKTDLTPEDEERRRRRRERNKIAATKCRLKKRERTVNLVTESEVLETQNIDLKSQIQELEVQRRQLIDMLSHHTSTCIKHNNHNNANSPTAPYSSSIQPPYDSPTNYPVSATPYEPNSPYIRPESANILASSYNCDLEHPPPSNYNQPVDTLDISSNYTIIQNTDGAYLPPVETPNYIHTENYNKSSHLLLIDGSDSDYTEQINQFDNQDLGNNYQQYHNQQQCHNMNVDRTRQKFGNSGMDNGCMA